MPIFVGLSHHQHQCAFFEALSHKEGLGMLPVVFGYRLESMIAALSKVIKRMHYPLGAMLTCVRWYVAYPLSLRHLE